jgi:putative nucleotidyltransferase with HDIG domain
MLTHRPDSPVRFRRSDVPRIAIAAGILVLALAAILGSDILPEQPLDVTVGQLATRDILAPRAIDFESKVQTAAARKAASDAIPPQYTFTTENAIAIAGAQQVAFEQRVSRIDTTFAADLSTEGRRSLLEIAVPNLSDGAKRTLVALDAARWAVVRTEAARILDATLRTELRDTEVDERRTRLQGLMAGGLGESERMLAAELISPLIVPNSSFSASQTDTARAKAAEGVVPVRTTIRQGEVIVRSGSPLTATDIEKIDALGLRETVLDVASFAGWAMLALLMVGTLLSWIWRFRPELWHRDNVLVLIGLLVVGATLALKVTAGRPTLPFFLPTAAIAILLAILLDASTATVIIALIAVIGGAVNGNSLEFTTYVFLGGMAGIVAVRRGDRLAVFIQAAVAVAVASALVVTVFSLLGARDLRGILELWFASGASAAGSGIAAVGTFAVLGSVFGILTVFQLLELANPSQPLLRRLLIETPGTYHHSLMVGNLGERAAEAIGADPLVTRVAAYYHDVGKLANPLAFIENQAGGENIHDQLDPEVSAGILKQHVADGIDLAYKARLPKALIAFIPQHHGTALMSYFWARAKELAGPDGTADERKFRHAGPKPQSREAALLMLADGVEASVRSLASRDEPAIRVMVTRIIEERTSDGQFDECDLTLRDLELIREAFVGQLLGMYHTRIAYPQNVVVELESRRAAAGAAVGGRAGAAPAPGISPGGVAGQGDVSGRGRPGGFDSRS